MRLIDADELTEHIWRYKLDSRELIAKMIDHAPTVNTPLTMNDIYKSLDNLRDEILKMDLKNSQTNKLLYLILETERKITKIELDNKLS